MRAFFRAHWKVIVTILLLVVVAMLTMSPTAAGTRSPDGPPLAARLQMHVTAIGSTGHDTAAPARLEAAARYIERALAAYGYQVRRQACQADEHAVCNVEVSVANVAQREKPARIFIIGASDNGSGTAAVLELARLLKDLRPSRGTELKFVFAANGEGPNPGTGNFIAFVGTLASSRLVQDALSAFRAASDVPAQGLAAPAYVQGVTLSGHAADNGAGYPAMLVTDTAFTRYPYHRTAEDTADQPDYASLARVVQGLAHTIEALAGARRG